MSCIYGCNAWGKKEKVHIAGVIAAVGDSDVIKAIEAFAFLITVQGGSGGGYFFSTDAWIDEKHLRHFVVFYIQQVP